MDQKLKIKYIINSVAGKFPDKELRDTVGVMISDRVYEGMPVTDITTPEDVNDLKLVYAVDLPEGPHKILTIETANGVLNMDNIKINLQ